MASRSTISGREEIADGIPVRHRALAYLGSVLIEFLARSSFKLGTQLLFFFFLFFFYAFAVKLDAFDENSFFIFYIFEEGEKKRSFFEKKDL